MIVSRRSMLLSRPSNALMRCAGSAASGEAARRLSARLAQTRMNSLMKQSGRPGVKTIIGAQS